MGPLLMDKSSLSPPGKRAAWKILVKSAASQGSDNSLNNTHSMYGACIKIQMIRRRKKYINILDLTFYAIFKVIMLIAKKK